MLNKIYKSIIWLRLDSIGDAILSSSMLPYIKDEFKKASITVVCQEHIAELYEICPFVDNIIEVPNGCTFHSHEHFLEIVNQIKDKKPDLLLNSVYSKHHLSDLPGLDFIPERISFIGNEYTKTLLDEIEWLKRQWEPELEKHRYFLVELGIESPPLQPQLWLSERDMDESSFIFLNRDPDKILVLFAGVRTVERFYDKYWEALKGLDYFIVLLGNKNDYDFNQEQLDKSQCKGINLSGKLSLRESIAIIKLAKLVVGGETGLAHAACAVGTPNIILLGGGHYGRFIPYSLLTTVVTNQMKCFRCNWHCPDKNFECVSGIDPLKIREAILNAKE